MIANVSSQHNEELAILWLLRDAATRSPHYSLSELAKIDGRVESHLDGLRVARDEGWQLCVEQLAANEDGEVFAAGVLAAVETEKPARIDMVLGVVEKQPNLADALISALSWLPFELGQALIKRLLGSGRPVQPLVGLGAMAAHGQHPGALLVQALRSPDLRLKGRALRAAGEFADRSLERDIAESLRHTDAEVRFAAAWAGALLGLSVAVLVLREIAESASRRARDASHLAARRMDLAAAVLWQKKLAGDPRHIRTAIIVAGAIGDSAFVPWLISLMNQLPLTRLAGESFTMITGVGLDYRDLDRKPPADFESGPNDDPADENVEMDPDDNLPWPDPALVQKWWDKHRSEFPPGTRHLCGKPISVEWCKTVLRDGFQRQRAAAALELAILQPGTPLFNVKAPGFRQIQLLGKPQGPIR